MTIKSKEELQDRRPYVDLTGPQGNAFWLMGYAIRLAEQLGKDADDILKRMRSDDYDHLVDVFEWEFGEYVDLYR